MTARPLYSLAYQAEHDRIFGRVDPRDREPGRSRSCRSCGDYHRLDRPWPHNCRQEPPKRNKDIPTPMKAPSFGEFVTDTGEAISNRQQKAEFMARHDLVEYDAGTQAGPDPWEEYRWKEEFAADVKRAAQLDELEREPIDRVGETELEGATEIDTDNLEVFK